MPSKALLFPRNAFSVALAEAVLFAAKKQWKEANQRFQRIVKTPSVFRNHLGIESLRRINYAWALDLQGRTEDARTSA